MRPVEEMPERWAIWIDLEGFSFLHENYNPQSLAILGRLVEDIFLIGSRMYPESSDRLFIHQIGDGFIIVSDFMEDTLERPLAIAMALMRSLLSFGGLARAGIAVGDFADISQCYPPQVRDSLSNHGLPVGEGVMSITRVMGGALINAHHIANREPTGPSLRIARNLSDKIQDVQGLAVLHENTESIRINWLISELPLVDTILRTIRGEVFTIELLKTRLDEYLHRFDEDLPDDRKETVRELI